MKRLICFLRGCRPEVRSEWTTISDIDVPTKISVTCRTCGSLIWQYTRAPKITIPIFGDNGLENHTIDNTPEAIAAFKREWREKHPSPLERLLREEAALKQQDRVSHDH